ncbi:MAG TPA: PepSY-like domain-containing protein [Methylobacter sp.]|jgi:uncharacterized membrane protein YkoI
MKNQYVITAVLVTLPMIFGQANAGEKELSKSQVPKAVIDAFEKAYPNAKGLEFEEEMFEGKTAYEVEYKENGIEYELLYSADGTLLQKEQEIDGKSLPEPVAQAVKKAHPKAEITEVEKLMKPDGTLTGYEVDIKTAGKKIELELDVNGNIIKTENE